MNFICPVCSKTLALSENTYKCENNHCYDLAKKGYVNLFQGNGSKLHGDDKVMVASRTRFLNAGFYENLKNEVVRFAEALTPENPRILDCGCGECYYTEGVYRHLLKNGKAPRIMGIDISKEAVIAGKRRCRELTLAVGSVFHLPCESDSFDLILNLFSPFCKEEYSRVLKDGGHIIMAIPLENHLWELKQAIYEKPYKNQVQGFEIEDYELVLKSEIRDVIHLKTNEQISDLFSMTPYYYKTSHEDRKKLEKLNSLDVTTEFAVLAYRRK